MPDIDQLKSIRKFVFVIDADTYALRQAVENSLTMLRLKYPEYEFWAIYGGICSHRWGIVGNGIEIVKRNNNFYLIYAGEICDRMEEIEITEEDAEIAQRSSMDAYNIIIKYQNRMMSQN